MHWKHIARFEDFSPADLYAVLKLRQDIFIIEQGCSYDDIDNLDIHSEHLMVFDGEALAGYARIVPEELKFEVPSIGRIVVQQAYRGKGLGKQIVRKSEEIIRQHYPGMIKIEAQEYLLDFYESLGFRPRGKAYDVDGIPHIEMSSG